MKITRNGIETTAGPSEWFTGAVFVDTVAAPSDRSHLSASSVHFTPGARTAWHTHPQGQTIWVTEGIGLCQREDGPIEVIRPGDRVFFEPDENHWHGAALMRATVMHGAGDVRIENVPDPSITDPTDALVRVTHACICGSDLWPYKTLEHTDTGRRMGHEAVGVVEAVGAEVRT